LVLNKSGTTNRHVQTAAGDFINPTVLTVKKGATLHLKEKSKLILEDDTTLIVEEGGKIILDNRAEIIVQSKATFIVAEAVIQKHKGAKVIRLGQK